MAYRLFCLPHAGSLGSEYASWVGTLGSGVEVHPIVLPGRGRRRNLPLARRLEALLPTLTAEVLPLLDRPYALFGHSLGALLAYELALELRERGSGGPVALFAAGRRAPQLPPGYPELHALPDAEFHARLRRLGGTPRQILGDQELMSFLTPLLRADLEVCETYRHRPAAPLDCPVVAFAGRSDATASPPEVAAWETVTRDRFSLHVLGRGHFFLREEEPTVLEIVARTLSRPRLTT